MHNIEHIFFSSAEPVRRIKTEDRKAPETENEKKTKKTWTKIVRREILTDVAKEGSREVGREVVAEIEETILGVKVKIREAEIGVEAETEEEEAGNEVAGIEMTIAGDRKLLLSGEQSLSITIGNNL